MCRRPIQIGFEDHNAPATTSKDDAHVHEDPAGPGEQRSDLGLELLAGEGKPDGGAGARHAVEMLRKREGPAGIAADELEGAVAAQQAVVVYGHRRLAGIAEYTVDRRRHGRQVTTWAS